MLLSSVAAPTLAVEIAGVKVPDTVTAEGKTLKLNGAGLRTKLMFKVYVASLYLETPSKDSAAIVSSDQVKAYGSRSSGASRALRSPRRSRKASRRTRRRRWRP